MPRKKVQKPEEKVEEVKKPTVSYYEGVGRRKEATVRVRLNVTDGEAKGTMTVNGLPIEKYFPGEVAKKIYLEPFRTTNTLNRFAVTITTAGGGLNGQLSAVVHGTSRALSKVDPEKFRSILKKRGFLTRDPRAKQRRKAGFAGKARARKQSPKR